MIQVKKFSLDRNHDYTFDVAARILSKEEFGRLSQELKDEGWVNAGEFKVQVRDREKPLTGSTLEFWAKEHSMFGTNPISRERMVLSILSEFPNEWAKKIIFKGNGYTAYAAEEIEI